MSGIVGIFNLDGAPVDPELLQRITRSLTFRGPDAQKIWREGSVGFGHTLLRTSSESKGDEQPASLDGKFWITADARIDARADLIEKLNSKGSAITSAAPDHNLILHAYRVWGSSCVDHLLGDFSFAIWDAPAQKLFCARDQFGVKCFYYARVGNFLAFSNTLDSLRIHPGVSDRLNELAVADFLLFESSQEPGATTFCDIRRLEPASTLELENCKMKERRYWTLPAPAEIRYKHPIEYVERFQELMDTAVADRVRAGPAGVLMSGGLDSSVIAVSAKRVLNSAERGTSLRAITEVYDQLIPHEERRYAGMVAEALDIPIEFLVADDYPIFQGADPANRRWPEPAHWAWGGAGMELLRHMAVNCRVVLTGHGGDPTLTSQISAHFRKLLSTGDLLRAFTDALQYISAEKRFSRLYLRKRWSILFGPKGTESQFPGWLNPDFERQYRLRQRLDEINEREGKLTGEGVRPFAHGNLKASMWPSVFEALDSGVTRIPVEACHPFFDLRLVSFLLSLPALPWCSDKELLREATRGVLPDAVRLRKKSPLMTDPVLALLQKPESAWVDKFEPAPDLERFVVRQLIKPVLGERDSWAAWINLRPLSLSLWLELQARNST